MWLYVAGVGGSSLEQVNMLSWSHDTVEASMLQSIPGFEEKLTCVNGWLQSLCSCFDVALADPCAGVLVWLTASRDSQMNPVLDCHSPLLDRCSPHVRMHTRTHARKHTHTHIHTRAHTHTHTLCTCTATLLL